MKKEQKKRDYRLFFRNQAADGRNQEKQSRINTTRWLRCDILMYNRCSFSRILSLISSVSLFQKDKEDHLLKYPNWTARENYASNKKKKKKRDRTIGWCSLREGLRQYKQGSLPYTSISLSLCLFADWLRVGECCQVLFPSSSIFFLVSE